ncbi:MAG TPA: hypothetical protein VJB99_04090 [Patescibacteria group bacterium]|nr:hypothetical protein [Patescibacteria group bacterium]
MDQLNRHWMKFNGSRTESEAYGLVIVRILSVLSVRGGSDFRRTP